MGYLAEIFSEPVSRDDAIGDLLLADADDDANGEHEQQRLASEQFSKPDPEIAGPSLSS